AVLLFHSGRTAEIINYRVRFLLDHRRKTPSIELPHLNLSRSIRIASEQRDSSHAGQIIVSFDWDRGAIEKGRMMRSLKLLPITLLALLLTLPGYENARRRQIRTTCERPLTPSCPSIAIYVLNGFLEFHGVFGFCDNTFRQASHHESQVLGTMTEKHEEACTPACAGYLRN